MAALRLWKYIALSGNVIFNFKFVKTPFIRKLLMNWTLSSSLVKKLVNLKKNGCLHPIQVKVNLCWLFHLLTWTSELTWLTHLPLVEEQQPLILGPSLWLSVMRLKPPLMHYTANWVTLLRNFNDSVLYRWFWLWQINFLY